MAQLILVDEGLSGLLDYLTAQGSGEVVFSDCEVGLFTAPTAPDRDTVLADLSEPTYTAYARQAFSALGFTAAAVASHLASAPGALVTFTTDGTATDVIYGWFLVDSGGTILVAIALFDYGPYTLSVSGQTVKFTPTAQLQSLFSATP